MYHQSTTINVIIGNCIPTVPSWRHKGVLDFHKISPKIHGRFSCLCLHYILSPRISITLSYHALCHNVAFFSFENWFGAISLNKSGYIGTWHLSQIRRLASFLFSTKYLDFLVLRLKCCVSCVTREKCSPIKWLSIE